MSNKKAQPGKIGAKLWAIFDPAEENKCVSASKCQWLGDDVPHSATRSRLSQKTDRSRTRSVISPLETNAILALKRFPWSKMRCEYRPGPRPRIAILMTSTAALIGRRRPTKIAACRSVCVLAARLGAHPGCYPGAETPIDFESQ